MIDLLFIIFGSEHRSPWGGAFNFPGVYPYICYWCPTQFINKNKRKKKKVANELFTPWETARNNCTGLTAYKSIFVLKRLELDDGAQSASVNLGHHLHNRVGLDFTVWQRRRVVIQWVSFNDQTDFTQIFLYTWNTRTTESYSASLTINKQATCLRIKGFNAGIKILDLFKCLC